MVISPVKKKLHLSRKSERIPRSVLWGYQANLRMTYFLTVESRPKAGLSRFGGTVGSFNGRKALLEHYSRQAQARQLVDMLTNI